MGLTEPRGEVPKLVFSVTSNDLTTGSRVRAGDLFKSGIDSCQMLEFQRALTAISKMRPLFWGERFYIVGRILQHRIGDVI